MTLSHIRKQHEHQTSSIQLTSEKSVGGRNFRPAVKRATPRGTKTCTVINDHLNETNR